MIAEGWYDRDFIRDWSNGAAPGARRQRAASSPPPISTRRRGHAPRGVGSRARPAGDLRSGAPATYAERDRRSADARRACAARRAAARSTCCPAFERYAALCRDYPPERVERITGVPAAQIVATARLLWERRPVAYFHWTGLEQHTNASQTVRALSLLYALTGCFDAPGGNVRPTPAGVNDLAPLSLLARERSARRRWASPSGRSGPARQGWATARRHSTAPSCTARRTPCAGWWASAPTCCSPSRTRRGARRARAAGLPRLRRSVPDARRPRSPTWCCPCPPRGSARACAWASGRRRTGERHVQLRPRGGRAPGRGALGHLDRRASWPGASAWAIASSAATRTRATRSCSSRPASRSRRCASSPSGVSRAGRAALPSLRGGRRAPAPVGFATPSRRVEIYSGALLEIGQAPLPEYVEPAASPVSRPDLAARYPLVLTTAKVVQFCHSQHRSLPRLRRHSPDPQVELHPTRPRRRRGIAADDWVLIETPRATMRARARLNAQPGARRGVRAVRLVAGVRATGARRGTRRKGRARPTTTS